MHAGSISGGEILLRLALVVVLCGAIGLEREAREQIAGLRTHVIVGLGSALFTLVSAYGFTASAHVDPTRIAAQVVSGIGFLGGGVILRYGVNVRGVTTAAALWISAAIGMAGPVGFYVGAAATTMFALVTLAALRRLKPVVRRRLGSETLSLEVALAPGASMRSLLGQLRRRRLRVEGLQSIVLDGGGERFQLDIRGPASLDVDSILSDLLQMDDVARIELAAPSPLEIDSEEVPIRAGATAARRRAERPRPADPLTPRGTAGSATSCPRATRRGSGQ